MKKGILIVLGMFLMTSNVEAKNDKSFTKNNEVHYSYEKAVSFVERGIEFHIFLNGDFDFNSKYQHTYVDYNGRRTKRTGIKIRRDFTGKIKQVGNVFINYDFRGNVSRIGNVFMQYRYGNLTKVGNLKISYNRWGKPMFFGHVKNNDFYYNDVGFDFHFNFGDIFDYNDAYFYRNDFRKNYFKIREDTNFYYYKAKPHAKIGKRSKILKRRKLATRTINKKTTNRISNNTYKKKDTNQKVVLRRGSERTKDFNKRIR